ncbi:MAG: carbonate dehydratase [Proteobacteria bacterium]|nr:MAG: carbonate dehydratase [Pseudomonadota bacterium]PIE40500.1 MAG: carbonate dehydratase [Gammaproteobacteria bacterium]
MKVKELLVNNREWAETVNREKPDFFEKLSLQQNPEFLWIGCSDSRVPANEIVGLLPGELFVHRNVANLVVHTDFNCLSVIQYAVDVLQVRHIIVCGHYGCGGIRSALAREHSGLINNWLRHVQDIERVYHADISAVTPESLRVDKMCELNVIAQVDHVTQTTIVRDAWSRGQYVKIHGWVYGIQDGIVNDLGVTIDGPDRVDEIIGKAVRQVFSED